MATEQLPEGDKTQLHAVVFGLYPSDSKFYTVVERAPESGGAPGTPTVVAWLEPGVRHYTEFHHATDSFNYYRFYHQGFGFDAGTPTAWFRARPVEWDGAIPNLPREALLDLDLALDDSDGTVDIVANGGRRVKSIEWDFSTSSFPTEPTTTVDTDSEGDVTVTDAFTLTAGQTGYVTVQFFDQVSGGGNLLGTLRASTTRPTTGDADPDTTLGTLVLNGDFEHDTDGAYWGNVTGDRGSIETTAPLSGTKSLKLVSDSGAGTFVSQVENNDGFSSGTLRYIPAAADDAFELTMTGKSQADNPIRLRPVGYDGDKSLAGAGSELTIQSTTTTTSSRVVSVPAGSTYIVWQISVPADSSGPRDYFVDDITARRIDSTVDTPSELSKGGIYYINESQVTPDSSGGVEGSDPGFLYWGPNNWKFIHPNGTKYILAFDTVTLISLDGTKANTAELMCYVGSDAARFTGLADTSMRRIVGVRKSRAVGWQYLGDSGWATFTPNSNDALLAEPVLTTEVV